MPNRWSGAEKSTVIDLSKNNTSEEISEKLSIMGFEKTPAAIRGWLQRNGISLKKDPDKIHKENPKILYYDIETTNFNGDFGELMVFGYRWHSTDRYHTIKINDFKGWNKLPIERRDKFLLRAVTEIISDADVLVGHYAKRFDHPFIQTRLMMHKMPPIPDTVHIDTWRVARYQLKMTRNSLKNLADRFECAEQKDHVSWKIWRRFNAHDEAAINEIAKYCEQDVKTQYDITQRLLPICKDAPNMNVLLDEVIYRCPSCSSRDVIQKGYRYTKVNKYKRFVCKSCGKWARGRKTETDKNAERMVY